MIVGARLGCRRGIPPGAGCLALVAILGVVPTNAASTATTIDPELEIKAALVYNIARYVAWPPERLAAGDTTPLFRLGVDGDDELVAAFRTLAGRSVGAAVIEVVPVHTTAELRVCHLVYFASSETPLVDRIADATLTVSDCEGFSRSGGMVELVRERNKIRFLVNPAAARARGLQFSSQLLKLATIVEDD